MIHNTNPRVNVASNTFEKEKKAVGISKLNIEFHKYKNTKIKASGVEPGYQGQKEWNDKDMLKLNDSKNPNHKKYITKTQKFIYKKLEEPGDNEVKKFFANLNVNSAKELEYKHIKHFIFSLPYVKELKNDFEELKKVLKNVYIVKLDYDDPPEGSEVVKIPFQNAKGPSMLGSLGKLVHQHGSSGTRTDKNFGAVTEALANDVYRALKLESQHLRIRKSAYTDGKTKLLLESKWVEGPEGEKFDVMRKHIKHGILPGNKLQDPESNIKADAPELGRQKIKALLMGDKDKVGRMGDNIGFIVRRSDKKAVIKNIDPGKSLPPAPSISQAKIPEAPTDKSAPAMLKYVFEKLFFSIQFYLFGKTDSMIHQNIHTDFSMYKHLGTLSDQFITAYENYSIFDDTLLSEKMQGVHDILDNWDEVNEIFEKYKKAFNTGDLNFAEEIQLAQDRLNARKEYIANLFEERLKLKPEELDFLDNIEKLTSKTKDKTGPKNDRIRLDHLYVIPEKRKEWHLTKDKRDGGYTLSFNGKSASEARRVYKQFRAYCDHRGIRWKAEKLDDKKNIQIKISKEQFTKYKGFLSESLIARHKNQRLNAKA